MKNTGTAKDWLGIPIDPFDGHIEGKYIEALTKPKLDERTGEHIENAFAGNQRIVLYSLF